MVNEPKGLWLPREVLIAEERAPSEERQMTMIFEKSPWFDGKLSFTRVRYRNDRGEVIRVVGSWAPASLLPLSALADCDDERVLGLILKRHGNRAAAAYSDEAVDVIRAIDDNAALFEFEDGDSFLIHSCALYSIAWPKARPPCGAAWHASKEGPVDHASRPIRLAPRGLWSVAGRSG
jgi:hypothetical protein